MTSSTHARKGGQKVNRGSSVNLLGLNSKLLAPFCFLVLKMFQYGWEAIIFIVHVTINKNGRQKFYSSYIRRWGTVWIWKLGDTLALWKACSKFKFPSSNRIEFESGPWSWYYWLFGYAHSRPQKLSWRWFHKRFPNATSDCGCDNICTSWRFLGVCVSLYRQ